MLILQSNMCTIDLFAIETKATKKVSMTDFRGLGD